MRLTRLAAVAAACIISSGAYAADFTQAVENEDGKAFTRCTEFTPTAPGIPPTCAHEVPTTLGQVIFDALNVPDQGLTNEGIVSRGLLALRVRDAKALELSDKERDVVKSSLYAAVQRLGYRPVLVVKVLQVIDPPALKSAEPPAAK